MNIYTNSHIKTSTSLIEEGFQQVSKNNFLKQKESGQYSVIILQTFCRRSKDGKVHKVSEKRFNKLKNQDRHVFIEKKYFPKKNEMAPFGSPLGTFEKLPRELATHILGFLPPFEKNKIKTVSSEILELIEESNQPEYAIARENLEILRPLSSIPHKYQPQRQELTMLWIYI